MAALSDRLAAVLNEVLEVKTDSDGALIVAYLGTLASLRTVPIAEELELVSLTQFLAGDVPLTAALRQRADEQADLSQLGTVTLVSADGQSADVLLRYNFPGSGLTDAALRMMVLMVLDKGIEIRAALTD